MAKSELRDLYNKISKPGVKHEYFSDSIDFKDIIDHFKDVENQDRPDGIILLENTVYIVEHFQISIYSRKNQKGKWDDKFQQALRLSTSQRPGNRFALYDECENWEKSLLDNWLASFADHLNRHLQQYSKYEENANKKYPSYKSQKFIVVVEDNSTSIITDDGLCILDIQEFVVEILSHNEVDGVIVFNTSTRGNLVIAKDRSHLEADISCGRLRPLSSCGILALIMEVLTPAQRADIMERIYHILVNEKENIALDECIEVIKHDNPRKTFNKKLCFLGGIASALLITYIMKNVRRKL